MRVGVHPVAIGVLGVVVHPFRIARDHLFEEPLDVGQQRGLKLVDEQRTGRVHRPEADETLTNVESPGELHHPIGQIHELDSLIGLDHNGLAVNRQAADIR